MTGILVAAREKLGDCLDHRERHMSFMPRCLLCRPTAGTPVATVVA